MSSIAVNRGGETMTVTTVAFLRGINVGGHRKIKMSELRDVLEAAGLGRVRSYIQSGNLLFDQRVTDHQISDLISEHFALDVPVIIREASSLRHVAARWPFGMLPIEELHVGFLGEACSDTVLAEIDSAAFLPDRYLLEGNQLYLHLPNGSAKTRLPTAIERRLPTPLTLRNLRTVNAIIDLFDA